MSPRTAIGCAVEWQVKPANRRASRRALELRAKPRRASTKRSVKFCVSVGEPRFSKLLGSGSAGGFLAGFCGTRTRSARAKVTRGQLSL
ncbi:hypothetical protein OJAV_G00209870 [Oryzias javanicus]|uniref:Uncharacterized protein n=1 Tax=Oryzias javanicus TaxID=123683 RepID=A0A437C704_ORYJA|nr:hypothetical protein OJAV_G00209870 [Oryzias javanicus]